MYVYIMFYVLIECWHILKKRRLLCLLSRGEKYTKFIYICYLENHTKNRFNIDNIMLISRVLSFHKSDKQNLMSVYRLL